MYLTQNLDQARIVAGEKLTRQLDKSMMIVKASLWFYFSDILVWKLIIATPEVNTVGPRRVYQKVQSAISKIQSEKKGLIDSTMPMVLSLENVAVIAPENPLIKILSQAIGTDKGISHIRFSKNTINGQFIEDAYIYRLTRQKSQRHNEYEPSWRAYCRHF